MDFNNGGNNCGVQLGPPIEDIQTEDLEFMVTSGEGKIQLLPTPWPRDNLPPSTASLMSIASKTGLLAAAGPEGIILASTESLRKALSDTQLQDGQLQRFEPQLKIPMNFRISQVTFSSDEKYLILSAESGGGLAVYEVSIIMNGSQQSAFELSTSGKALRALVPNPAPEKAELLALITSDGNLMVANLRERSFVAGAQGLVLKDRVSSMSWSTKGKQLVTGLGDGTAHQMTPEGELKAVVPRPPDISADDYISSILWLENHMFLCIYTPSSFDPNQAPPAKLYLVTRTADCKNYTYQRISNPVQPFGLNRSPPHHFMLRLREFPPNLQDVIIMASTASTDVGLLTRSKVPLTKDKPPEKVTGVFTVTELTNDSRRAQLPLSAQFGDTSPIGFALDLSSRENVPRPISGDEISETSSPVPGLTLLNNEGVLASWWIIYPESVRQKTVYPGLAFEPDSNTTSMTHSSSPFGGGGNTSLTTNQSSFSNHTFTTVLGAPKPTPTFGSASQLASGSTFGAPSALGTQKSAWGSTTRQNAFPISTPEFGKTAFGSNQNTSSASSFAAPTFGKPSIPSFGVQNSVWGSPASNASNITFGNNSGNEKISSVFGSTTMGTGEDKPAPSGFASFASKNEFGRLVSQSSTMESVLKVQSSSPITSHINTIQDKQATSSTTFGLGSTGNFVLGTTFKSDPPVENDVSSMGHDQSNELFGNAFVNALGGTAVTPIMNSPLEQPENNSTDKLEDQNMDQSEPDETPEPDLSSNLNEKENKELSPESSYEIIENNDFMNIFKSKNSLRPKPLFGEIQSPLNEKEIEPPLKEKVIEPPLDEKVTEPPLNEKVIEPHPNEKVVDASKYSHNQEITPDGAKALESSENVVNSNIVSQPFPYKNENKTRESTVAIESISPEKDNYSSHNEKLSLDKSGAGIDSSKESEKEVKEVGTLPITAIDTLEKLEKKYESEPVARAEAETELQRHNEVVLQREAEEKRRNEIVAQRKAEEKRHKELVAQRQAEEKRRNEIVAQRKAEEKRHKDLLARWEAEEKRREELQAQKEAEEKQAIVDSDDNCMQNFLASELEPTTRLNDFVAHSDYGSTLTVESIPAQVEAVYRDINSMIDTLGLNTRSLHEFILGHSRKRNLKRRSRSDLKDVSIWTLGEIKTLSSLIENELSEELENNRIKNIDDKLESCKELQKDLIKLRAKHVDIKKIIATSQDPNLLTIARAQPLGVKQATQQHDLRRNFMKFQRLLSEAEEGISVLKAKIVAQTVMNQKSSSSAGPTVEAVMRTITKLTNMAEKKSGDIDVLEGQLRKLKVTSCIGDFENPTTPTKQHKSLNRSSFFNSFSHGSFSPDHYKTSPTPNILLASIASSGLQVPSPSRRTLTCYSAEEKAHLRYSLDKKRRVKSRLRLACQKLGVRVRYIDNDI
ncbi:hypothetical protein EPUL_003137 [Erysiphe pulchra]|uniref:Nucleoporin Nup159/Nup146 N-terminal domain-containing protein n=1 Tax=Erysiphe pulchra TaxID=225359 RepID=A0A2S4PV99_9PEZI|nr:hypothetical protein EPUL_003137 [Erysiphe pulchra]